MDASNYICIIQVFLIGFELCILICLAISFSWFTIVCKGVNLVLLEPDSENFLYTEALAWQAHLDDLKK